MSQIEVNARTWRLPTQPSVVVCVDGCEPDYIAQAVARGYMPWMKSVLANGTAVIADCVVPAFTNPNNLSIVTGAPPSVHAICGNYLYLELTPFGGIEDSGLGYKEGVQEAIGSFTNTKTYSLPWPT